MIPGVPGGDFYAPRPPRGPRGPGVNFEAARGVNFPFSYDDDDDDDDGDLAMAMIRRYDVILHCYLDIIEG